MLVCEKTTQYCNGQNVKEYVTSNRQFRMNLCEGCHGVMSFAFSFGGPPKPKLSHKKKRHKITEPRGANRKFNNKSSRAK